MSSPRDRDPSGDPFGDRPDDGSGWQEPSHLGGGDDARSSGQSPAEPVSSEPAALPEQQDRPGRPGGGLFGPRGPRQRGVIEEVFSYEGDLVGAQGWALQHGWTISDGGGPADAPLAELIAAAPMMRLSKDHRPASVLRGRYGQLEMVAFDVIYASGRHVVPQYAVTAVPMLAAVPRFRLSPARFWKHRTGGLVAIPSGSEPFDLRWVLLAAEDSPQLRHLVQDPAVQGLLLGSDDGDEFWSGAGHVAAVRPDGQRPELIEHHSRLLGAIVRALGAG